MKLSFGTAGIRGIVGKGEAFLNEVHAARIFDGYAKYLIDNVKDSKKLGVVIGRDNRIGGKRFAMIAYKILTSYGIKVYFNNQMLATPFISYLTRTKKAAGAINITASHNPKEYNGIKIYDYNGCQLLPNDVSLLTKYFKDYNDYLEYENFDFDKEIVNYQKNELVENIQESDYDNYINEVLKLNYNNQNISNINTVYSSLHGTGYDLISRLFKKIPSNINYETNEIIEDENFTHVKNPNPESELAFINSIKLSNKLESDIILVTDPDSDRVGVAIKDSKNNNYKLLNGNEIAILITDYLLKYKPRSKTDSYYLIYSFVSTTLPAKMCLENGIESYVTETGFKWIGNKVDELFPQGKKFFFAFEESFGSLINDNLAHDKDAIQSLYILSIIASLAKENKQTILDQLEQIYKNYGYMKAQSLSFELKNDKQLIEVQKKFKDLNFLDAQFIDYNEKINDLNPTNMYSYVFNDKYSWVALRPSGTEPKIKLYIHVINKDENKAINHFNEILKQTTKIFN